MHDRYETIEDCSCRRHAVCAPCLGIAGGAEAKPGIGGAETKPGIGGANVPERWTDERREAYWDELAAVRQQRAENDAGGNE